MGRYLQPRIGIGAWLVIAGLGALLAVALWWLVAAVVLVALLVAGANELWAWHLRRAAADLGVTGDKESNDD